MDVNTDDASTFSEPQAAYVQLRVTLSSRTKTLVIVTEIGAREEDGCVESTGPQNSTHHTIRPLGCRLQKFSTTVC